MTPVLFKAYFLLSAIIPSGFADNRKLDLAPSLTSSETTRANDGVKEVLVDGVPFYEAKKNGTTFYIPKLNQYDAKAYERAFCADNLNPTNPDRTVVALNRTISEDEKKKVTFFVGVFSKGGHYKCNGGNEVSRPMLYPGAGIFIKDKKSKVEGSGHRILVAPNGVGGGINF